MAEFSFEPIWRKIYLILHVADVSALPFFFFFFHLLVVTSIMKKVQPVEKAKLNLKFLSNVRFCRAIGSALKHRLSIFVYILMK